mmetsp:Transcript_40248/g.94210  ORF Transcript_40248/g.94210 Transcript_40248/m.94210 type:complete len:223 (-) Transcript_40248:1017-1685(-)
MHSGDGLALGSSPPAAPGLYGDAAISRACACVAAGAPIMGLGCCCGCMVGSGACICCCWSAALAAASCCLRMSSCICICCCWPAAAASRSCAALCSASRCFFFCSALAIISLSRASLASRICCTRPKQKFCCTARLVARWMSCAALRVRMSRCTFLAATYCRARFWILRAYLPTSWARRLSRTSITSRRRKILVLPIFHCSDGICSSCTNRPVIDLTSPPDC